MQHNNKNLIFIVAYNHENFLEKVIARIPQSVASDPANEILIIDDGSKDRTFFKGEEIRDRLSGTARLTVLKNPVNQGYGGNQKIGYRYAVDNGFKHVVLVHGDGQYAPELLPDLINRYDAVDKPNAVFGTRMADFWSPLRGGMPVYKFIGNKVLTFVQNTLLKSKMSEFHSGYRSYSVELLKKIPFERNSNDFHFDTEIIIQCLAASAKIVEVPIPTHYGDEICHVNGMQYAWNVVKASFHFRMQQFGIFYDRKYDVGRKHIHRIRKSQHSLHNRIINMVTDGSNVLEICLNNESISEYLREKHCNVKTISWNVDVPTFDPKGLGIEGLKFDYVILSDVIEHVRSPETLLDSMRASIAHNPTTVIASTGNISFIIMRFMHFFGQFNYGLRGILDLSHARLFTFKSFLRLFQQSGYVISQVSGVTLPATSIFGDKSGLGLFIEKMNTWLAKIMPSLFSYQMLVVSRPLPTVSQLLKDAVYHSERISRSEAVASADY